MPKKSWKGKSRSKGKTTTRPDHGFSQIKNYEPESQGSPCTVRGNLALLMICKSVLTTNRYLVNKELHGIPKSV